MKSQVAQIADMQLILGRLEEQEHRRMQRISQFLDESDERDILILETLLTSRHNASMNGAHKPHAPSKTAAKTVKALNGAGNVKKLPGREGRNFGPLTSKGRPRQRVWGVLRPAIERAIEELDEISSIAIYHHLKRQKFQFAAARPVPSIAAFLRMLIDEGAIKEAHPGSNKRPVVYVKARKEQRAGKGS